MQKIQSLFKRHYDGNRLIYNEVVEGSEWVQKGEGRATIKIDGTSCLVQDGKLFKRYDAKKGKTPPAGFIPAQEPDLITGHYPGWIEVNANNPADKYHIEAFDAPLADGTYELIGEKIQKNPYGVVGHKLVKHGAEEACDVPTTFDKLKAWLSERNIEGIVWHHPDGRMVKAKKKDFGLKW